MTRNEAAIPRNSCPLCSQLTRVPVLQFLPSRFYGEKGFRCSSCNERIRVSKSTQRMAYIGGLLALGAVVVAVYVLAPSGLLRRGSLWPVLLPLGLIAASFALPVFAAPFGRLALRLEPWVDETI